MVKIKPVIIGFAGKPQVGKTTAANYIAEKYGAGSFFIGDGIKREADLMLKAVGLGYKEEDKHVYRPILTWIAMHRRAEDPDYWAKFLVRDLAVPAVVSDIRFPNEVEIVEKSGGVVWKIVRDRDSSQDTLETEIALDDHSFVEEIENNGTFEDLYGKIDQLLVKYRMLDIANER